METAVEQTVKMSKAHGTIYTDIENKRKELEEVRSWIESNKRSEDVNGTVQLVPMQNKENRLIEELNALLDVQKDMEAKATKYINAERIALRAKEQIRGVDVAVTEMTALLKLGQKFTHLANAQEELLTFKKKKTQDINMFEHIKTITDFTNYKVKAA